MGEPGGFRFLETEHTAATQRAYRDEREAGIDGIVVRTVPVPTGVTAGERVERYVNGDEVGSVHAIADGESVVPHAPCRRPWPTTLGL